MFTIIYSNTFHYCYSKTSRTEFATTFYIKFRIRCDNLIQIILRANIYAWIYPTLQYKNNKTTTGEFQLNFAHEAVRKKFPGEEIATFTLVTPHRQ